MARPLLIFDLDETLVHATTATLEWPADFLFAGYRVHKRPFLATLLQQVEPLYDLAVWSSASPLYVQRIADEVFGTFPLKFAWNVERCIQRVDVRTQGYVYIKDLRKVRSQGYDVEGITIVDDSPEKICRQPRNHVPVKAFFGDPADRELLGIAELLVARARRE